MCAAPGASNVASDRGRNWKGGDKPSAAKSGAGSEDTGPKRAIPHAIGANSPCAKFLGLNGVSILTGLDADEGGPQQQHAVDGIGSLTHAMNWGDGGGSVAAKSVMDMPSCTTNL